MKIFQLFFIGAIALIFVTCAQPRGLTGGEKDTQAPKVLKLSPQNLTTGFRGHTIAMEFDEFVQIKGLNSELVVSPPLDYPVTYKMKGKRVFFEIQDTLLENTTYNFNFGNAIVDLNENNPLDSNLFVFSTGHYLDSGLLKGTVMDAYTQKPTKGAKVLLYSAAKDSAAYKGDPIYVTHTNAQGEYELRYLAEGNFQIFALETPGEDFKFIPLTKIAFHSTFANSTQEESVNLVSFKEVDTLQYISKAFSKEYFSFNIGFNLNLVNPSFTFTPSNDTMEYFIEEIRSDSFKFWIPGDRDIDSVHIYISDKTGYLDTAIIDISDRTQYLKKLKKRKQPQVPLKISLGSSAGVHHYFDTLRLKFNRPLEKWILDSMLFVNGNDTMSMQKAFDSNIIMAQLPIEHKGSSKNLRTITITHKWQPSTEYAFIFDNGAFTDILSLTNDSTTLKFKTKNFEDYGSFRFTVKVEEYSGPLLLELLDKKGAYLRTYSIKSGDVIFHELAVPGTYKFRMILDENNNGKWDTGDLDQEIQPEKIVYYKGTIDIRANWDMEETWEVDFK